MVRPTAPTGRRGNKKPATWHQLALENYGDVALVLIIAIFGLAVPKPTQSLAGLFYSIQHNVTTFSDQTGDVLSEDFRAGPRDLFPILFFMVVWIVVRNLVEMFINQFIKRWRRGATVPPVEKARERHFYAFEYMVMSTFHFIMASMGLQFVISMRMLRLETLSAAAFDPLMPWPVKFFLILHASYWAHHIAMLFLFVPPTAQTRSTMLVTAIVRLAATLSALVSGFAPLMMFLLALDSIVETIVCVSRVVRFGDDESPFAQLGTQSALVVYFVSRALFAAVFLKLYIVGTLNRDAMSILQKTVAPGVFAGAVLLDVAVLFRELSVSTKRSAKKSK